MKSANCFPFILVFACLNFISFSFVSAYEVSEEVRLGGFKDQQKLNRDFDRQRMSDVDDIKKKRAAWDKKREADIAEFKKFKAREALEISEKSKPYQENQADFKKYEEDLEKARKAYIKNKIAEQNRVKKLGVSEAEEYGLNEPFVRSDRNKRANLNTGSSGSGGSGSPSYTPPAYQPPGDFGGGMDYEAPPPPPVNTGAPEFFEPESIPGVPPSDAFDEPIPPPIFDEPEF